MKKNGDGSDGVVSRSARSSFRAFSNCIKAISSGASTVARSAVSAASSAVRDVESHDDQVLWAGFDTLEKEDGDTRRVLLLAFQSGYQVWDVEDTENVHVIVSANDGQTFFMQMLLNPLHSGGLDDRFRWSRPLLAVCADSSWEESSSKQISSDNPGSETVPTPTNVYLYSLKSQTYVHILKFRSTIYTIRCSSRVVAVLGEAQIHCFDATTLDMDYTIATNSIACGSLGVGYGPLAVGPRWIAYSGSRIANSSSAHFTSELISLSSSPGPGVVQFAKDSSKQIASGLANLGDIGYRSLTKYYSEILPNQYIPGLKGIGVVNEKVTDADSIGMVIIKDITNKRVISQFKAHKSPISALCFDPSGMLLVTASIQGHNINVFRIMPTISTRNDANTATFAHLFTLQRGFTNAVIQDISFSNDSYLIVVSSSRGTSHLFEINPEKEEDSPVPLSAISRIRSGNSGGWIGTVSGAASAAAGMVGGSVPGTVTSTFCYCVEKSNYNYLGAAADKCSKTNLLVFAPSGCMTQYALRENQVGVGHETAAMTGFNVESGLETEGKLAVEAIRRWSMIQNQSRRETQDQHSDIYGGGTSVDSKSKVFPEVVRKQSIEEAWKVTKKGVEDKRQLYAFEGERKMHSQSLLPIWARLKFRFQELVLNWGEGSSGGGEMEIEGIQTRTIETRRRDLVPLSGYFHPPISQQGTRESMQSPRMPSPRNTTKKSPLNPNMQSPRNTTQGDQMAHLESHGTETDHGVVHSEEERARSEEESQSEPVNKEGIAEEKSNSEDED